ncbi:SUKH-3 domain-containing protein [Actinoplanes sp. NPDC049548]|uniref:SUKH-3 domain-containing protein n=1 Tax=Actinoplanes sp. NPDC049548 TaxID=3155152 RepID=UPI003415317C
MAQRTCRGDGLVKELEPDVTQWLASSGRTPDRKMDVTDLIARLRAVGFDVAPAAEAFLQGFAYMSVDHEPSVMIDGVKTTCWTRFDPGDVATSRDARVARRCEEVVGKTLCPVGIDGFHLTLYIARDGGFYASRDASVFAYADSTSEMFRAMRHGVRPRHMADWTFA